MASNINACFQAAVAAGRMGAKRAAEASARIDELTGKGLSEADAIAKVAADMQEAAQRHTRQTALRIKRTAEALASAQAHPSGITAGVQALFARDLRGLVFGPNVEGRARAIRGMAHAGMVEVLDRFRARFLGLHRDKAGLQEFVRGLYGTSDKPEMQALSRAWSDTVERLRSRFEAAGGYLPQLQTWRLPQVWDNDAVRAAGRAEFVTYLEDAMAAGRVVIRDLDTGAPVVGDRAKDIISNAYNRISSNGLSDLVPGSRLYSQDGAAAADAPGISMPGTPTVREAWNQVMEGARPDETALWANIERHIGDVKMRFADDARGAVKGWAGYFSTDAKPGEVMITLRNGLNPAQARQVLLHEAVHAATVQQLRRGGEVPRNFHTLLRAAKNKIDVDSPENAPMRRVLQEALSSDEEFLAYGMTHPGFQRLLDGIALDASDWKAGTARTPGPRKTLWSGFVGVVRRALGLPAATQTLLEAVIRNAEALSAAPTAAADSVKRRIFSIGGGGGSLANSRSAARAFDWQTPDAWLDANQRFGPGDSGIFDLLTGHVDGIARDISMMEVLGPNPDWAVRYLTDVVKRSDPEKAKSNEAAITRSWDHVSGRASSPVSEGMANFFDQVRAVLTSAQLGSALLASFSDFNTMRQAATWNGLGFARTMRGYLAQMNPANAADRALAVRGSIVAEAWVTRASGGLRFLADSQGVGIGTRVADLVMRLSLLSPHTQAGKNAFGLEFLGTLADQADRTLAALDGPLQNTLRRHGVTDADWEVVRQTGMMTERGVSILSPEQVARSGNPQAVEAATRLLEAVNAESRFAIPEPGSAERALTLRGTRRGTIEGELVRSAMQYKSFPITVMTTHLMRGLNAARTGGDYGRYLATMLVGMTAMGALGLQLRQVSQGRDPRDMTDPKFWGAAFAQGGGAGLLGDFLYTGISRADSSFYMATVGGPIGGLVDDLARIGGMNIQALGNEQSERSFGADLARFVRRNTPGTNLWYTRAAMDRLMWDQLQDMLDPDAHRRFRNLERRAYRESNQEFWWRPGETSPSRAPSANPMIGAAP